MRTSCDTDFVKTRDGMKGALCATRIIGGLALAILCATTRANGSSLNIDITAAPYDALPNDGRDDAPAFQRALDDVRTAGNGSIHIPAGSYTLHSAVVSTATGVNMQSVSLIGDGVSSTVIHCASADGGIFIAAADRPRISFQARDFSLLAGCAGAGTALSVYAGPGGVGHFRGAVIRNLRIGGATESDYFNVGLDVTGPPRAVVTNVTFAGPAHTGAVVDSAPIFRPAVGIRVNNSFGGTVRDCHVTGAHTAFEMISRNAEGGQFEACSADYCRIGFHMASASQEPGGTVCRSSIRARDIGIRLERRRIVIINRNTFATLTTDAAYPYKDIYATDCRHIDLTDNVFMTGNTNRTCFALDGRMSYERGAGRPENVIISQNDFNMSRAKAISFGRLVTGVHFLANEYE